MEQEKLENIMNFEDIIKGEYDVDVVFEDANYVFSRADLGVNLNDYREFGEYCYLAVA